MESVTERYVGNLLQDSESSVAAATDILGDINLHVHSITTTLNKGLPPTMEEKYWAKKHITAWINKNSRSNGKLLDPKLSHWIVLKLLDGKEEVTDEEENNSQSGDE